MVVEPLGTPIEDGTTKEVSFFDVMPYPSVLISLIVGVTMGIFLTSSYYSSRYGEVIDALPKYEDARKRAEENTEIIRKAVKENEEYAKEINSQVDKIIGWGNSLRRNEEKIVKSD